VADWRTGATIYNRMCSLMIECVLSLFNVFSHYRMCSLIIECVLLLLYIGDRLANGRDDIQLSHFFFIFYFFLGDRLANGRDDIQLSHALQDFY